ncbi:hypothetical protein GQ457_05G024770 [Hibiscus cannabinus]
MELEQEEIETTNIIRCYNCGVPAEMRTSWTKASSSRRFLDAIILVKKTGKCCSFKWFDPEIVDRPRAIILGLLKSKGALEKARKKEREMGDCNFLGYLKFVA